MAWATSAAALGGGVPESVDAAAVPTTVGPRDALGVHGGVGPSESDGSDSYTISMVAVALASRRTRPIFLIKLWPPEQSTSKQNCRGLLLGRF